MMDIFNRVKTHKKEVALPRAEARLLEVQVESLEIEVGGLQESLACRSS